MWGVFISYLKGVNQWAILAHTYPRHYAHRQNIYGNQTQSMVQFIWYCLFFLKKFIFIFIYVYLHVSCIYATCVWVPAGSEGSIRCPGLDLQAAVKHPVWMLRTMFQSYPRAARTLNHSIISLALLRHFLIGKALLWWQNLVASEGGDWLGEDGMRGLSGWWELKSPSEVWVYRCLCLSTLLKLCPWDLYTPLSALLPGIKVNAYLTGAWVVVVGNWVVSTWIDCYRLYYGEVIWK